MPSDIPMGDLRREYARLHTQIDAVVERVLRRGWFILGEEGAHFEAEWAAYCGAAHAVGVGNGTNAIHLALRAAGVGPGDEVIVPALTATFTALAVVMAGARPVFADIDLARYTLDPAALEATITPRTAAVIPVHLYGCPADMEPIVEIARKHGLFLLEDASQAHGARFRSGQYEGVRVGALGDAAAFSFYPSKNLGAYGDAGAVVTGDAGLADKVRMLRHGGQRATYDHELLGTNSRLDEIQAAILRAKLPHLDAWNRRRRAVAARYGACLQDVEGLVLPSAPQDAEHVFHLYVVRTPLRDNLRDYLAGAGVHTSVHYPRIVPQQGAFASTGYQEGACPNAEKAAAEVLSLPVFPQLSDREVTQVVQLARFFFAMR